MLLHTVSWQEETLSIFGKDLKVPRLISWYGDEGTTYNYSGVEHRPQKWIAPLLEIKACVQEHLGEQFNSVLVNLYRNGQDSMGWHADNEAELGDQPIIAWRTKTILFTP